jgi:hypothetical protein
MFGFPVNINEFGDSPVKSTNSANSGFVKPIITETFYSIKSGIWGDASIWQTISGRVGLFPTQNDTVYIRSAHIVSITTGNINSFVCNNLIVNGTLNVNFGNTGLNIYDGIIVNGQLNLQSGVDSVRLYGNNNYIPKNKCSIAVNSTFIYFGKDQLILDLNYSILEIRGSGIMYTISDLICNTLTIRTLCTLELGNYNLTCNLDFGTLANNAILSKNGGGNILFVGVANFGFGGFILADNVNVEFRGGFASGTGNNINTGLSTWNFTTNNQNITFSNGTTIIDALVNINNGITITVAAAGTGAVQFNNVINGLDGASSLINRRTVFFGTQTAAQNSMSIGTFDRTTFANTVGYTGNYSVTLPYTTYHSLTISGTGTKTLGGNTTLNGDLTLSGFANNALNANLECSIYNLSVTGITYFQSGGLYKSGAGNLLFIGNFQSVNGFNTSRLSLTGNPNVEFRGGITSGNFSWTSLWNTGTGIWTFTTNNQVFQGPNTGPGNCTCKFVVSGAITITYTLGSATFFYDKIDGTAAGSTWINQTTMNFVGTELTPMATGVFNYLTSASSTLAYFTNANITLPYTIYNGLSIYSPTGLYYTLANNTILNNNLFISTRSELRCNTYNLSVTGTTTSFGTLNKSGVGNILFVGLFTAPNGGVLKFLFAGNPDVEFRNGITTNPSGNGSFDVTSNFGTGTFTFSTNSQTINMSANGTLNFTANILISGAVNATFQNLNSLLFSGAINGNNALSTFRMAASTTLNYRNATQPMATGILDTSTNLNTWIYGLNNQNIKGSPTISPKQVYRNLRFSGSGTTKTLQGFVSVLNTYTLDAGVTVNNNGYTLTNP